MSYTYKDNLKRYRIVVNMNGEPQVFKRYGTDPDKVKKELVTFIHERYDMWVDVHEIDEDKTHPIKENTNV